jgi:delta 1-pyrroline-5-carboxylate dehydrogenase
VIEREAQERLARFAEHAERDGRIVARVEEGVPSDGWFVAPCPGRRPRPDSPVVNEEIFGPLLTVESVRDVDDAVERIDGLGYALTSGLFARNPTTIERVARRNPVGNLYVNRRITGAMVGRQPFGGNRLSGTGTKAGGPDYLLQFVEPRVVTRTPSATGLVVDLRRPPPSRTASRKRACSASRRKLGMGRTPARSLPWRTATGWPSTCASTSTPSPASAIHGARMKHGVDVVAVDRQVGLERVHLPAAERVALGAHVEHAEVVAVEHDEPSAGPEHGRPGRHERAQRVGKPPRARRRGVIVVDSRPA